MSSLLFSNNSTAFPTFPSSIHHTFNTSDSPCSTATAMESFGTASNHEQEFIYEYLLRTSFHSVFLKFGRLIKENLHDENSIIDEIQIILSNCQVNIIEFARLFNMMLNFYQNYNQYLNQNGNDGKFSIKILIVYLLHKFVKNLNFNPTIVAVVTNRMDALDQFILSFIKISEDELRWQNDVVLQKFKNLLYQNFQVI